MNPIVLKRNELGNNKVSYYAVMGCYCSETVITDETVLHSPVILNVKLSSLFNYTIESLTKVIKHLNNRAMTHSVVFNITKPEIATKPFPELVQYMAETDLHRPFGVLKHACLFILDNVYADRRKVLFVVGRFECTIGDIMDQYFNTEGWYFNNCILFVDDLTGTSTAQEYLGLTTAVNLHSENLKLYGNALPYIRDQWLMVDEVFNGDDYEFPDTPITIPYTEDHKVVAKAASKSKQNERSIKIVKDYNFLSEEEKKSVFHVCLTISPPFPEPLLQSTKNLPHQSDYWRSRLGIGVIAATEDNERGWSWVNLETDSKTLIGDALLADGAKPGEWFKVIEYKRQTHLLYKNLNQVPNKIILNAKQTSRGWAYTFLVGINVYSRMHEVLVNIIKKYIDRGYLVSDKHQHPELLFKGISDLPTAPSFMYTNLVIHELDAYVSETEKINYLTADIVINDDNAALLEVLGNLSQAGEDSNNDVEDQYVLQTCFEKDLMLGKVSPTIYIDRIGKVESDVYERFFDIIKEEYNRKHLR